MTTFALKIIKSWQYEDSIIVSVGKMGGGGIWCYMPVAPYYSMNKNHSVSFYIVSKDDGYANIPSDDVAVDIIKAIDLSSGNNLDSLVYNVSCIVNGEASTSSMKVKGRIFIENGMMNEGQVFLITAQVYRNTDNNPIKKTINALFVATQYSYEVVHYIVNAFKNSGVDIIPYLHEIPRSATSQGSYIFPVVVI